MKYFIKPCQVAFLSLLIVFTSCQSAGDQVEIPDDGTVITNVNIIDIHTGNIQQGHVLVQAGVIREIMDLETTVNVGNGTLIDGTAKYLIPGLAEMHAHVPSLPSDDPLTQETLFLYLSNGVTTIRGMLGHPLHLELREKAKNQEILSPRFYASSPPLNGNTVRNPEEARSKVTDYAEEGYDFLKILPGIRLHVFDEIVKTANEKGIAFAGHVPSLVGVRHALENKYATIDHLDSYLEGLVPELALEEENINPLENGFFGYNFTDLADLSLMPDLVQMTKENEVWVVPTQSLFDRWFSPTDPETLAQEEEMQYISPETLENWVKSKRNLISVPNYNEETWSKFIEIRRQLILSLHKEGHGLLLGSDAPQVFNVPGFSIHHELKGMLEAGLSPLEALQIGSVNPAKFLGGNFGEIKEGYEADLILLDNNPLESIQNLKNPVGVMARGQWIDREQIEEKLKNISQKYKEKLDP